jgi:hypothetical protein
VVDTVRCRRALRLAWLLNSERAVGTVYQHVHGDKDTFRLGFEIAAKADQEADGRARARAGAGAGAGAGAAGSGAGLGLAPELEAEARARGRGQFYQVRFPPGALGTWVEQQGPEWWQWVCGAPRAGVEESYAACREFVR